MPIGARVRGRAVGVISPAELDVYFLEDHFSCLKDDDDMLCFASLVAVFPARLCTEYWLVSER